jgi:glycosyltransferase involved in cell wall biosynthesis
VTDHASITHQPGSASLDVLIVEHTDPEKLVTSGIDTIIAGMVRHASPLSVGIVGVTSRRDRVIGVWHQVTVAGVPVPFFPVAVLDRAASAGGRFRMPHSLTFIIGLLRYRDALTVGRSLHSHRIETGAVLTFLRKVPLIQFVHNDSAGLLGEHSDSLWRRLKRVYRILEQRSLSRAQATVLFNRTDFPRVARIARRAVHAQTWYDPEVFFVGPEAQASDVVRVLWAGRLESQKDPALAVRVSRQLAERGVRHLLTVVGDGSMRPELVRQASADGVADHIRFVGAVPAHEVADAMRASDVFLMTSRYEGSPTVLVEAAACGLPTVATPEADPDGVLDDPRGGIRTSTRQPSELAEAVLAAANARDRLSCAALVSPRKVTHIAPTLLRLGLQEGS